MEPGMFNRLDSFLRVMMVFAVIGVIVGIPASLWVAYHVVMALIQYVQ